MKKVLFGGELMTVCCEWGGCQKEVYGLPYDYTVFVNGIKCRYEFCGEECREEHWYQHLPVGWGPPREPFNPDVIFDVYGYPVYGDNEGMPYFSRPPVEPVQTEDEMLKPYTFVLTCDNDKCLQPLTDHTEEYTVYVKHPRIRLEQQYVFCGEACKDKHWWLWARRVDRNGKVEHFGSILGPEFLFDPDGKPVYSKSVIKRMDSNPSYVPKPYYKKKRKQKACVSIDTVPVPVGASKGVGQLVSF